MARPSKAEKYSAQAQKELYRELCGDALQQMKKQIKTGKIDFQSLANFVNKAIPIVTDENTETGKMVTMDMLLKKSVKVSMRIQEANEEGLKEEDE